MQNLVIDGITLSQLVSFVGGFAGMLSLGILLLKYVLEKPNLKTVVEKAYYSQPHDANYNFSTFYIALRFENKGRRNTTIHSVDLSYEYDGKRYCPPLGNQTEIIIIADDVKRGSFNFLLQKNQFGIPDKVIKNAKLKIEHTYGRERIIIPEIPKA